MPKTMSGTAYEPGTAKPLQYATVSLHDQGTAYPVRATTVSDERGRWAIDLPDSKNYRAIITWGTCVGSPAMFQKETIVYPAMWSDFWLHINAKE